MIGGCKLWIIKIHFVYIYPKPTSDFASRTEDEDQTRISLNCTQQALMEVVAFLSQNTQLYQKTEIVSLDKVIKMSYIVHFCLANSFVNS